MTTQQDSLFADIQPPLIIRPQAPRPLAPERTAAPLTLHPCDSRCLDAEGDECHCICGGKNHGIRRGRQPLNFTPAQETTL